MGDRTWTGIQFSGIISKDVAEGLLDELNAQCDDCSNDVPNVRKFSLEHLQVPHNQFTDDECNYATMEGVEDYCRECHISYRKTWNTGGDYSSGVEIYNALVDQTWAINDVEGEPVIGVNDLVEAHAAGKIEDMINYLKSFTDWEKNYPPLEIQ